MSTIYLLHLSDLHLAGIFRAFYKRLGHLSLSVYDPDALTAVSEIMYNWRNFIDGILISGDIATTGSNNDLQSALDIFSTPDNFIPGQNWLSDKRKPTLKPEGFNKPIILVPGNHDRYANLSGFPGKKYYQYFYSYWPVGIGGVQSCFLPNEKVPILAIVCADFSLNDIGDCSCFGGHFGQGRVYKDRLQKLVQETQRIAKSYPECGIIWMLHFAPKFEKKRHLRDQLILLDSDDLIEAAEKLGVNYFFCGHTHQYLDYSATVHGSVKIHCAGTSTCLENDLKTTIHLRLIVIENGKVIQVKSKTYCYDPKRQVFSDTL